MNKYILLPLIVILSSSQLFASELTRGIYISELMLLTKPRFEQIFNEARQAKIDTLIVDINRPSEAYANQIRKIKEANMRYVARVVMFPGGGNAEQIHSKNYWENKYRLVESAVAYGADEIQLDYIRYASKNRPSHQNAMDVHEVIKWFKAKLAAKNIPLQIDVFGIAAKGESLYIGQDLKLFADSVDVMCPMTYPSHFEPFLPHFKAPYKAVKELLTDLNRQFDSKLPFRVNPYIEVYNYHYSMNDTQRQEYIRAQIQAAQDTGAEGWYAWSPGNNYNTLFQVLRTDDAKGIRREAMPKRVPAQQPALGLLDDKILLKNFISASW